jgi:transcriptional regulator NrdR family protein
MRADKCQKCRAASRVLETRGASSIRRRRECVSCGYRWSTCEVLITEESERVAKLAADLQFVGDMIGASLQQMRTSRRRAR